MQHRWVNLKYQFQTCVITCSLAAPYWLGRTLYWFILAIYLNKDYKDTNFKFPFSQEILKLQLRCRYFWLDDKSSFDLICRAKIFGIYYLLQTLYDLCELYPVTLNYSGLGQILTKKFKRELEVAKIGARDMVKSLK